VAVEDERIVFLTAPGWLKARNMDADARVAYVVEPEHAWARAFG